jgi:tetratricopeptide (TPR) repeat protein
MLDSRRRNGRRLPASAAVAILPALALALSACSWGRPESRRLHVTRETSFKLIDEGRDFDREGSPILALERFNRAALVHETPAAWFEMARQFELADKGEQAAAAYNRALDLAPDYQEARLALLSLGYTPPGYDPTDADLELANALGNRRDDERRQRQEAAAARAAEEDTERDAALIEQRERIVAEAAQRRLPTQAEVQAVIFDPQTRRGAQLPSATDPTYAPDSEVILGSYAYHMRKADQLKRHGQIDAAEREYLDAIAADSTQIEARLELGDMQLHQERHERALYHYRQAMDDFPDSPRPFHKLGNYYLDIKRPDEARRYYRLALDKDSGFLGAYNNLAILDMNEGKFDGARELLDEMIRQDATYANAYLNRGIIASDIDNDRDKALDCWNRYVDLEGVRAAEVRGWIVDLQSKAE